MKESEIKVLSGSTGIEKQTKISRSIQLKETKIPEIELLDNLGLYMTRQNLSRILFIAELYKKIIETPGVIMEFGVRWGQNMSLFSMLRGMFEPYNYSRKIIGFDTFEGFPNVHSKDGEKAKSGDYSVAANWEKELENLLSFHEQNAPIGHKKKFELIKGDATQTVKEYLKGNQETIISLAFFDFDIYEPTKECLEAISPYLTKGSVVVFDELNCPEFPGETIALREILGINNVRLKRDPNNPVVSYFIVE